MSVSTGKKMQRMRRLERGLFRFAAIGCIILLIVIGFLWVLFAMDTLGIPRGFAFIPPLKLSGMINTSVCEFSLILLIVHFTVRDRKARREDLKRGQSDSADGKSENLEEEDS